MNRTKCRWHRRGLFIALMVGVTSCQQAVPHTSHVEHIENGLMPAVVIHGQPALAPMKLAERMAYYGVPGVNIAVINDGKLEWAKGYGVLEARGTQAVTAGTLFQAASISKPVVAMTNSRKTRRSRCGAC